MARPSVSVNILNGQLGLLAPSENGITVVLIASPAAPTAGYGTAFLVSSIAQVKAAFSNVANADVVAAFEKGFYAEAAEGTKVYVLAMAQTTTLATMLSAVNADKALNLAAGTARLLVAIKFPAAGYVPTIAAGFDNDVDAAVSAAQLMSDAWRVKNKPFRALVQGFAFTNANDAKDYSTSSSRNVAIVVGSVADSSATATMLVAGRAAGISPQQNLGRIKSGSLEIAATDSVKIGSTVVDLVPSTDLTLLHTKRYISFERNEIAAGYVITDDNMLTTPADDYNNLRHGRVIDNAHRVVYKAYYEELKDDVEVNEVGRLDTIVEQSLSTKIQTAISQQMVGQLATNSNGSADVKVLVNPDTVAYAALYAKNNIVAPNLNIIQSETIYLFIYLKPKGCLKYINIYIGLSAV